ncbi:MAG: ABC transporter permease [Leptolinea sp.]|nr:ABC transporter permease [Leptolinea sp.]
MTKQFVANTMKNNLILIGIVILMVITSIIEPNFLSRTNFENIIRQFGTLIMVALGMTFVIMGGFIDLSVSGIVSLVAISTVMLIDRVGQGPAIIIGILIGLSCGLLNSWLILSSGALTQAEALFLTYGMSLVYGALALIFTGGITQFLTYSQTSISIFDSINSGMVGIFSISFIIFLILLIILYVIEKRTFIGRTICLTGGNKVAARLAGIPISKTIVFIYAVSGIMTAIGAVILVSRVTLASPVMGQGYETQAILGVVIGGTALLGGKGSVLRTVLGTLLLILMSNCLNLMGVSTYIQNILRGAILITAIWLDSRKQQTEGN